MGKTKIPDPAPPAAGRIWLMKSEPDVFSFDDLLAAPRRTTAWDGVRNHEVRNAMRDLMCPGDRVLFYHSNAAPPGVAGLAEIAGAARPDPTQFDPADDHHDPKSDPANPTWLMIDVRATAPLPRFVPLSDLKACPALAEMALFKRTRLSVSFVTPEEYEAVLELAGVGKPAF